jgi:hypothetical protein
MRRYAGNTEETVTTEGDCLFILGMITHSKHPQNFYNDNNYCNHVQLLLVNDRFALLSFDTEPNENVIVGSSGPDGIRRNKNTAYAQILISFYLFNQLVANWVNSVQESILQAHPNRIFRGKNICIKQIGKYGNRM